MKVEMQNQSRVIQGELEKLESMVEVYCKGKSWNETCSISYKFETVSTALQALKESIDYLKED